MLLKHKTAFDTRRENKPKVLYTAHPNDFEKYIDLLSKDVWRYRDCVIYYFENKDDYDEDEYLSILDEMDLILFPITTNLVSTENTVMNVDVEYALKKHIPLLPIMVESKLDNLFNKVGKQIQYLDKYQSDNTAISYEEKLERFLENLFANDDEIKEIKKVFRGQIFLSYRKKDRKYAKELMKMIHTKDDMLDVSIWYDEYLTTGENFRKEIINTILQSHVVVISITESVLEDDNYIMKYEYPEAMKYHKTILPIEMQTTDYEKLKSKYPAIQQPIKNDIHDIYECLKNEFKENNDFSLEKKYYIASAYLYGISVEKDYEIAEQLMLELAKEKYIPAIKKLIWMYMTGFGVKVNLNQALIWQQKYIELLEQKFESEKTAELFQILLEQYEVLYHLIIDVGDFDGAIEAIEKGLNQFEQYIEKFENLSLDFLVNVNQSLGYIFNYKGDLERSLMAYENGLELLKFETQNKLTGRDISLLMDKAGIYIKQGKIDDAIHIYKTVTGLFEQLVLKYDQIDIRFTLVSYYNKLGKAYETKKMYDDALSIYKKALENLEYICQFSNDDKYNRELFVTHNNLANVYEKKLWLKQSLNHYRTSFKICEERLKKDDSFFKKWDYIDSCNNLGINYILNGNSSKALDYLLKAKEKIVEISEIKSSHIENVMMATNFTNLGVLYHSINELENALNYFLQAKIILVNICNDTDVLDDLIDLLKVCFTIEELKFTLGLIEELAKDNKEYMDYYHYLLCLEIDDVYCINIIKEDIIFIKGMLKSNENKKVLYFCNKVESMITMVLEKESINFDLVDLIKIYRLAAKANIKLNEYSLAIEYLNKAIEICYTNNLNFDIEDLWSIHHVLCERSYQIKSSKENIIIYEKTISFLKKVLENNKDEKWINRLIKKYFALSKLYFEDYDTTKELEVHKMIVSVYENNKDITDTKTIEYIYKSKVRIYEMEIISQSYLTKIEYLSKCTDFIDMHLDNMPTSNVAQIKHEIFQILIGIYNEYNEKDCLMEFYINCINCFEIYGELKYKNQYLEEFTKRCTEQYKILLDVKNYTKASEIFSKLICFYEKEMKNKPTLELAIDLFTYYEKILKLNELLDDIPSIKLNCEKILQVIKVITDIEKTGDESLTFKSKIYMYKVKKNIEKRLKSLK